MHLFIWDRINQPQSPLSFIPTLLGSPRTHPQGRSIGYYLQGHISAASCWGSALASTLLSRTLCSRKVEDSPKGNPLCWWPPWACRALVLATRCTFLPSGQGTPILCDVPCQHLLPKAFPSFLTPFRAFERNFTQGSCRSSMLAYSNIQ